MRPQTISVVGDNAPSAGLKLDYEQANFKIGLAAVASGTIVGGDIQGTMDDIEDSSITPFWFNLLSGTFTDNATHVEEMPLRAVRIVATSGTGTIRLVVLQGRSN